LPDARGNAYAAVDLGAESGRVVVGRLRDGRVQLDVAHRFPNRPVRLPDGLRWNLLHLFTEALEGLRAAAAREPLHGVGVDSWGVDYALLDERRRVLGLPFHYRDPRTAGMADRAFARMPREDLYAVTGIQTMPINTVFQLLADEGSPALEHAAHVALVPDLLAHWLGGELANEATAASTTGLLDARTGAWAFVAAPVRDERAAILSSGTWSLLGLELDAPVLTDAAREANLTNERGVDGTTRLLKNVMGLWLVQECRRAWAEAGEEHSYERLQALAADAAGDVALFDPDDDGFLAPGGMPDRVAAACEAVGQAAPRDPGAVVRSILVSLACKYRWTLERLEVAAGRDVACIHVIGGGARNALLCRLTADLTGREVLAGPVEATALGNVLVQARAAGELASLAELREVAAASAEPVAYEPTADRDGAEATYRRFLDVTDLRAPAPA
jgi:rhamnulokinase